MNAVEFQTTVCDGIIKLPRNQQAWNGRKIRVILLDEANIDTNEISANESTAEYDFFNCAGIWENRDISQESIRAQAWRNHKK